jgi:hypothetical protein
MLEFGHIFFRDQFAGLPFPAEPAVFKVKSNFPELNSPDAKNTIKIITIIFPVIYDKSNLRTDLLFAQIHVRNPHPSALKCSTRVRYFFCPECLKSRGNWAGGSERASGLGRPVSTTRRSS